MSSSDPRFLSGSVFFFIKARIVFFYSCLSLDQGRYCVSLAHSHSSISGQVWAVGGRWCDEPENERTSQIDHRCYYVSLTNNFQDSPSHIQGPQWSLSFLSQCTNFSSLVHSDRLLSLLSVPTSNQAFGERAFSVCTSQLWNTLPQAIRASDNVDIFKKRMKTH